MKADYSIELNLFFIGVEINIGVHAEEEIK
jgi:hypothetical protein